MSRDLAGRYGPWALVAGASEGIGAAFATALAGAGLDVILVARRPEPLAALAATLPTRTLVVPADLSTVEGVDTISAAVGTRPVGLLVCNAAYAPTGPFLDQSPADLLRALDTNCRTPLLLAGHYLPGMVQRGRGGLIVMSSLAGAQGSPGLATYAATKAFGAVLAESLWAELAPHGVDVLACVAGAVATPGYARSMPRRAPGTVEPGQVVTAALGALGRRPRTVPGALMRATSPLLARLLPRRTVITMMGRATANLNP